MNTDIFVKFMDRPDVLTLAELAEILHCPISKLEEVQHQVKSLAKGPPFRVGIVALELLAADHLTLHDVIQDKQAQPTEALGAITAQIVSSSLREAQFGEFFENLLDDPEISQILLTADSSSLSDAIRMSGGVRKKTWAPVAKGDTLVIALSCPLTAALFFDRVWTLDRAIPGTIGFRTGDINERIALGLLDGIIADLSSLERNEDIRNGKLEKVDEFLSSPAIESQLSNAFRGLLTPVFEKLTARPVQSYVASRNNLLSTFAEGSTPMVIAALESLEWIDESQLTWEQVAEIRQDGQAATALKRMLHWLDAEMAGKSLAFVADAIELKYEEYICATKKHGVKLVTSAFGTFLDVRLLHSLIGTLIGGSIDPKLGAVIGCTTLALQGCRVAFETCNLHVESVAQLSKSPVAYIHNLRTTSADQSSLE